MSGWMYSGDMRRDASMVSVSGPLAEETEYGDVAIGCSCCSSWGWSAGSLGSGVLIKVQEFLRSAISSDGRMSVLAIRGTTFAISENFCIRSQSACRLSVQQSALEFCVDFVSVPLDTR